ncbi:23S rRNA (pseudouridine(1915)-N(3))-methyltransferase RlmH [Nesterenkonia aerolata]|uniref:Ribosomal RNA large subunit methyltransferase H n=1 Tax=Nesterenkonia aerolata TaxID=3074079 RepID=A0ABU2DPG7_9MICC|nr:23S rRNA (pseudouridine(1915)-N(3))-methyltransferase RlmH [Nesterenkonia sp. LY-0111]MDR8018281.1 23S rRNA (pseudouridine(1915)-N(3))-methyltransferase RlmH [Nesterenkonia sp. LY-0111]
MSIRVLAVGKKHEKWAVDGIERYTDRLRKPYDLEWKLLPHSSRDQEAARAEESARILDMIRAQEHVILLDERGRNLSSPELTRHLQGRFDLGATVAVVIGGAYGVDERLRGRADLVWSLSKLVFPHQLVRMILAEQVYRAQEISAGRPYHHV